METTIPAEIWTEIFAFSCTDDGCTGRALSAVSRAVHFISKPLKYQSLCVVGLDKLLKLLTMLSDLPSGQRKVKYLFIAGLDQDFDDSRRRTKIHRLDPSSETTEQALCRILRLVSSGLLVLHIHGTTIIRQNLLPEIELPVLRELTLHGPFKPLKHTNNLRPRALFPSLRRIHIHHLAFYPAKFIEQIVHAAPLLTHLRVPQSSLTPHDMQVALGMLALTGSASEAVYLPSSLEELMIETDPIPSSLVSWASNIGANRFSNKLQDISNSDGRVRIVDGRSIWMPVDQAKQEWLEYVDRSVRLSCSGI